MDDEADRPGDSRGTTRESALRPALGFRIGLLATVVVFAIQLENRLRSIGADAAREPVTEAVLVAVLGVLVLGSLYAFVRAQTTRVWVEHSLEPGSTRYDQWMLEQTRFGHRSTAYLRSPHTLRIAAPAPFGARPAWRLTVTHADDTPTFSVSAPWVTDLRRLLELLRPVVTGDPWLVADDQTRTLILPAGPPPPSDFDRDRDFPSHRTRHQRGTT